MQKIQSWNLPPNISDILPPQTSKIEAARRRLLRHFTSFGYQQVIPPLIEYADSLRLDEDPSLKSKTFTFNDTEQNSQLAIRSDITLQIARIDSHLLGQKSKINRLCYAGSVVTTKKEHSHSTRQPLQMGAEIYGSYSIQADLEIIQLMISSLKILLGKNSKLILDIGHLGIFRKMCANAKVNRSKSNELLNVLQSKNKTLLSKALKGLKPNIRKSFEDLSSCCGPIDENNSVILKSIEILPSFVEGQLKFLLELVELIRKTLPGIDLFLDLTELKGLAHYHNGLVFTAYCQDQKFALARGGRYDAIGRKFSSMRAATGFSLDIRNFSLVNREVRRTYYVCAEDLIKHAEKIQELRKKHIVIALFDPKEIQSAGKRLLKFEETLKNFEENLNLQNEEKEGEQEQKNEDL